METLLILEGIPDSQLVKSLGVPRRKIRIAGSQGGVCNYLSKYPHHLGIVDEDPYGTQSRILRNCKLISEKNGIKVLRSPLGFKLIVICPRLEEWFITASGLSDIDISDFGLPPESTQLKRVINRRLNQFNEVIENLVEVKNERILYLRSLIN